MISQKRSAENLIIISKRRTPPTQNGCSTLGADGEPCFAALSITPRCHMLYKWECYLQGLGQTGISIFSMSACSPTDVGLCDRKLRLDDWWTNGLSNVQC